MGLRQSVRDTGANARAPLSIEQITKWTLPGWGPGSNSPTTTRHLRAGVGRLPSGEAVALQEPLNRNGMQLSHQSKQPPCIAGA